MFEWLQSVFMVAGGLSTVWLIFEWILRLLAVFVMPRNRRPAAGLTWLTLTFLVPLGGWIVFLILGSSKLPAGRRRIQKHLAIIFKRISQQRSIHPKYLPKKYQDTARLSWSLAHLPVESADTVDILSDYHEIYHSIAQSIDTAERTVHIEYYTFVLDTETELLFAAIERARARNVTVRVLYDTYGSVKHFRQWRAGMRRLKAAGVKVQASLPLRLPFTGYTRPDLRNHRKIVIIDSEIGFMGSQNVIARNYHRRDAIIYDDLVVRLSGAIVRQLDVIFAADWFSENGQHIFKRNHTLPEPSKNGRYDFQVLPSGPGYEYENNLKIFNTLIYAAEKSITIVNPYFVPDESLMIALVSAARRGVDVVMINSKVMDQWMVGHAQRSYYEELFMAGVRIYWYEKPKLLHSKFMIIDNEVATVGSSNMDIRSFELDHELTLICYSDVITKQLTATANKYLASAKEVDKISWLHRRRYRQLLDNIARLTSSLQ